MHGNLMQMTPAYDLDVLRIVSGFTGSPLNAPPRQNPGDQICHVTATSAHAGGPSLSALRTGWALCWTLRNPRSKQQLQHGPLSGSCQHQRTAPRAKRLVQPDSTGMQLSSGACRLLCSALCRSPGLPELALPRAVWLEGVAGCSGVRWGMRMPAPHLLLPQTKLMAAAQPRACRRWTLARLMVQKARTTSRRRWTRRSRRSM